MTLKTLALAAAVMISLKSSLRAATAQPITYPPCGAKGSNIGAINIGWSRDQVSIFMDLPDSWQGIVQKINDRELLSIDSWGVAHCSALVMLNDFPTRRSFLVFKILYRSQPNNFNDGNNTVVDQIHSDAPPPAMQHQENTASDRAVEYGSEHERCGGDRDCLQALCRAAVDDGMFNSYSHCAPP